MLQFDIDVTATDAESRIIEGVAVPYGETANLGGTTYAFTRGSLKPARAKTPLLLGHDRNRPVGVMVELADTDTGATARFRVDNGPEGDLALEQAQSGSRGGLSIGAQIITASDQPDGTVTVTEAALLECSLVAIPAFSNAGVTSVAAQDDSPSEDTEPLPEVHDTTQEEPPVEDTTTEPVAAELEPIAIVAHEKRPTLTADQYVQTMVRAMKGDHDAARTIQASLDSIDTTGVVGLVPDTYTLQIIDGLPDNRPLATNVRRAALPATGMKLYKPSWTTTPVGGWIAEDDPTPSNAIAIGNHEVEIVQWAYGVSYTIAALERGAGVAEATFRQIILSYYQDVETKLAGEIAEAAGTISAGSTTLETIGLLAAGVYSSSGRRPDKAYMAPDVWASLIATEGSIPFTTGSTTASGISGQIAGLDIVVSSALGAGVLMVADSSVIELRESAPMQLRANVIGTMQVELGVTSFVSVDVELDGAVKIAD